MREEVKYIKWNIEENKFWSLNTLESQIYFSREGNEKMLSYVLRFFSHVEQPSVTYLLLFSQVLARFEHTWQIYELDFLDNEAP